MNEERYDLHCHTTCSDGTATPTEVLQLAKAAGLTGLSITDHDTVVAYDTAYDIAKNLGLTLLSGVEFSASHRGTSVHILGYGFDVKDPAITNFCLRHAQRRNERNGLILELLKKHKMPLSVEDVTVPFNKTLATIGRPHIAYGMVMKGYVATIAEAFKKFIGEGCPCYAAGTPHSVDITIETIHQAKGVAIIAHPHLIGDRATLQAILKMNFDGIESYYGNFVHHNSTRWLEIAAEKKWIVTGGSDFHGSIKPNQPLGSSWIDGIRFKALLDAIAAKK
jgi:predicted metal-dependent phosphoesterase TrpH